MDALVSAFVSVGKQALSLFAMSPVTVLLSNDVSHSAPFVVFVFFQLGLPNSSSIAFSARRLFFLAADAAAASGFDTTTCPA